MNWLIKFIFDFYTPEVWGCLNAQLLNKFSELVFKYLKYLWF